MGILLTPLVPIALAILIAPIDFIKYMSSGKRLLSDFWTNVVEVLIVIGIPIAYLSILDFGQDNNCCTDSATFSPEHRATIYLWIVLCIIAFFYTRNRKEIAPPIIEVVCNILLLIGIVLNLFIGYHVENTFWLFGNVPIILYFIIRLIENQKLILNMAKEETFETETHLTQLAWKVLTAPPISKYPMLLLISLPLIMTMGWLLVLFGQKPDSAIRAFTDTYKHGFSELDHLCENVQCGGHYLCSVAANGHHQIVKPQRIGFRKGNYIICNRQLLISNAFEELIAEASPTLHRIIRKNYNRIGNVIHKHYHFFENKYLSDVVYLMMKPLEFIFWLTLYTFDKHPENRIAKQYLPE